MVSLCLRCKGTKALCGKHPCPLAKEPEHVVIRKNEVEGEFTSPFVGSYNYPFLSYGGLLGRKTDLFSLSLEHIASLLSSTVYPFKKHQDKKTLELIQEITVSKNTPYTHTILKSPLVKDYGFDDIIVPFTLRAPLKRLELSDSLKTDFVIEKVIHDELKAEDMVFELYRKGKDVYKIVELFTIGLLGVNKRLVPTRWSITAVDDILFRKLVSKIKSYEPVKEYLVFNFTKYGNIYHVLLIPGKWEYEMIEIYHPEHHYVRGRYPIVLQEYESYFGRRKYAESIQGAYYAARLAVVEYLQRIRRQASAVVFREITPDYFFPVGVWQIRECIREAFRRRSVSFDSMDEAISFLKSRIRFFPKEKSIILNKRRLIDYF